MPGWRNATSIPGEAAGLRACMAPRIVGGARGNPRMEMRGRIEEGIAFLTARTATGPRRTMASRSTTVAPRAFHRIAATFANAFGCTTRRLPAPRDGASRLDATSRCGVRLEAPTSARASSGGRCLEGSAGREGGFYAFNDFHAAMASHYRARSGDRALREQLEAAAGSPARTARYARGRLEVRGSHRVRRGRFRRRGKPARARPRWRLALRRQPCAARRADAHADEAARRSASTPGTHYDAEAYAQTGSAWGRRLVARIEASATPAREAALA